MNKRWHASEMLKCASWRLSEEGPLENDNISIVFRCHNNLISRDKKLKFLDLLNPTLPKGNSSHETKFFS